MQSQKSKIFLYILDTLIICVVFMGYLFVMNIYNKTDIESNNIELGPGITPAYGFYCRIKSRDRDSVINFFRNSGISKNTNMHLIDSNSSLVWFSYSPFGLDIKNGCIFNQDSFYYISLRAVSYPNYPGCK